MNTKLRIVYFTLALIVATSVLTINAGAQCSLSNTHGVTAVAFKSMKLTASLAGASHFEAKEKDDDDNDTPSIVGFWHVKFLSKGNPGIKDGDELDNGFAQWHPDGTEIMNSNRPPATSNFCLGVWAKKGRLTYKLNHFALSSTLAGNLIGPANIREEVTLDPSGNSYTGAFMIEQFDVKGTSLGGVVGEIKATRITVDTPAADLF